MQAISVDLLAILKSHFQAGADGFRGRVSLYIGGDDPWRPIETAVSRISLDKSLQTDADAFEVEFQLGDNDWPEWLDLAVPDVGVIVEQWYGDAGSAVQTFRGFLDTAAQPRDPSGRTIILTGRDFMKKAIVQGAIVTAPQGADEAGAVRTAANYVYLNSEVSAIVADLLTHLDFPDTTVSPTSYLVAEYIGNDNDSYAKMFSELGALVGYRSFTDELGDYHFESPGTRVTYDPDTGLVVPDWVFTAGVDLVSLEADTDDLELSTRVKVVGPMATVDLTDAWQQTWVTSAIAKPTGVWYDPTDATHLWVLSGSKKRMYQILQSTRAITYISAVIPSTAYPAGLSGDPADATIYWVLDAPWKAGSGSACTIIKRRKSDHTTLATYNIGTNHWVDIKADSTDLWLANLTTGKFHRRNSPLFPR